MFEVEVDFVLNMSWHLGRDKNRGEEPYLPLSPRSERWHLSHWIQPAVDSDCTPN